MTPFFFCSPQPDLPPRTHPSWQLGRLSRRPRVKATLVSPKAQLTFVFLFFLITDQTLLLALLLRRRTKLIHKKLIHTKGKIAIKPTKLQEKKGRGQLSRSRWFGSIFSLDPFCFAIRSTKILSLSPPLLSGKSCVPHFSSQVDP